MNHLKTLLIALLALPQFSQAQNSKIQLGIEGGLNRSQFLTDNKNGSNNLYNRNYSGNIRPSAGIIFQVNTKSFFSFKTGISFDRKAYTTKTENNNAQLQSTYQSRDVNTFDYISLPLLGKLTFGKKVQFFLNAGVYFAFLVDQNILSEGTSSLVWEGENYYNEFSSNNSIIDRYKRRDFGLIGGLGLGVPIKKHWYISLEAREVVGLLNLYNSTKYKNPPTKNANFNMLLGISYKLGLREEKK
ncbi:hypothetical protein D3C71_548560 [compost metagenome]